jgi:NitT/TauT family transport system permease protein
MMRDRIRIGLYQIALAAAALMAWESVGRISTFWRFLIGTPTAVAREFWSLLTQYNLWEHFVVTGSEAVIGLCLGTIIGSFSGLLLWYSDSAARVARPFVLAFGSMPIFAFAPLLIVWFGVGFGMKVALAAFSTVFVAFNQGYRGATLVAGDYLDTLRGMNAQRSQIFRKVIVPGSIEWVLASMRLNIGFGLLGAFIGEFIASDRGLGYLMLRASGLYNVPRALAAGIGIIVLAVGLDAVGRTIERRRFVLVQLISVPRLLWSRWR